MQDFSFSGLTCRIFNSILLNMKTQTPPAVRSRAEILGAIAAIPSAVQGKICEMRKTLANGTVATYHNLQWWADGKNHTVHIPKEKLDLFKEAAAGGERLLALVAELSESDTRDILSSAPPLKKKSSRSPSKAHAARRR